MPSLYIILFIFEKYSFTNIPCPIGEDYFLYIFLKMWMLKKENQNHIFYKNKYIKIIFSKDYLITT